MTGDGLLALPERLHRLEELAVDLWWSWHPEARAVFRRLDYTLWRATAHNPVRMLRLIPPDKLQEAIDSSNFPIMVRQRLRVVQRELFDQLDSLPFV